MITHELGMGHIARPGLALAGLSDVGGAGGRGFLGFIILITMLRADKSAANTALTIITLLAVGVAVAAQWTVSVGGTGPGDARSLPGPAASSSLPALACLDDLAGDTVLSACEKALFGSAEFVAAAVSLCGVATRTVDKLRRRCLRQQEYDRGSAPRCAGPWSATAMGSSPQVLAENYRCTPMDCPAFRLFSNRRQITANMEARAFDGLVARYAASWNAPQSPPRVAGQRRPGRRARRRERFHRGAALDRRCWWASRPMRNFQQRLQPHLSAS